MPESYTSANRTENLTYLAVRCACYFKAVLHNHINHGNNVAFFIELLETRISDLTRYANSIRTFRLSDSATISETEIIQQEIMEFGDLYKEIMAENQIKFERGIPERSDIALDQKACVAFADSL